MDVLFDYVYELNWLAVLVAACVVCWLMLLGIQMLCSAKPG
jgi:hypothetical protein